MKPSKISHVVMMGDRLSVCGERVGLHVLSGSNQRSDDGLAWSDYIGSRIANQFIIQNLEDTRRLDATGPSIKRVDSDLVLVPLNELHETLSKDRPVDFKGKNLVRNYDESGLTACDSGSQFSKSMGRLFGRTTHPSLGVMRKKLFNDDALHELSRQHKAESLVIECSGSIDLFAVSKGLSAVRVNRAIKARIDNVNALIGKGYQHFVLFNLPNLVLTPHVQSKDKVFLDAVQRYTDEFNRGLGVCLSDLTVLYPYFSFELFDVNPIVKAVYDRLDPRSLEESDANPLFCDEVHAAVADHFYTKFKFDYLDNEPSTKTLDEPHINITEDELLVSFRRIYGDTLRRERNGFLGAFQQSNIGYKTASLHDILFHALLDDGWRTLRVIKKLQWIDEKNQLNLNIPVLKQAFERVESMRVEHFLSAI